MEQAVKATIRDVEDYFGKYGPLLSVKRNQELCQFEVKYEDERDAEDCRNVENLQGSEYIVIVSDLEFYEISHENTPDDEQLNPHTYFSKYGPVLYGELRSNGTYKTIFQDAKDAKDCRKDNPQFKGEGAVVISTTDLKHPVISETDDDSI